MARTTSSAVLAILLNDYDSVNAPSLTPFIDSASIIVDRVAACATAEDDTLTSEELELIERWLAAHCYASSDQPYSSKSTERASATFQGRTGMYLEGTKYGQMAITLDHSGCLAAIASGERRRAGMHWLGKPRSEQITYDQRD